jgi:predicted DsbA family dithiol-disulfide isomerase
MSEQRAGDEPITVDVVQDVACPWCRIGKRHLELALERWDGPPVEVRWWPFLLDESIPPEGRDFREHMRHKTGGDVAALEPIFERVRRAGAAVGLTFRFDRVTRAANTLAAHRLIALAPPEQRDALVDAVEQAYFEDGRDIGDVRELAAIAAARGMDAAETEAALRGDAARAEVLDEVAETRRVGVTAVPCFIFDGRLAVTGAHPPEVLLDALRQVAAARG